MPKPPVQAATMQSCLQRLQSLQQQFLHIDSPGELADAEQEGGHILWELITRLDQHFPQEHLVDFLGDAGGAVAEIHRFFFQSFEEIDGKNVPIEEWRKKGVTYIDLVRHFETQIWVVVAELSGRDSRLVLNKLGDKSTPIILGNGEEWVPTQTIYTDFKLGTSTLVFELKAGKGARRYDRAEKGVFSISRLKDYRQQGKRYALFTAELLARIQTAPLDAEQDTTDKPKRGLSVDKLEPIVAGILATEGRKRNLTAEDVYRLATDAGHKTSPANIKKTHSWEVYATGIGKARQSNRPKQAISDTLDVLVDESRQIRRTGRKTKPIEPGE